MDIFRSKGHIIIQILSNAVNSVPTTGKKIGDKSYYLGGIMHYLSMVYFKEIVYCVTLGDFLLCPQPLQ